MNAELRLSVEDSPNSAGMAIDAIRCAKLALERGIGGPLVEVSAVTMKHPPRQFATPKRASNSNAGSRRTDGARSTTVTKPQKPQIPCITPAPPPYNEREATISRRRP